MEIDDKLCEEKPNQNLIFDFARAFDTYSITDRRAADLASSIIYDISNQVGDFKAFINNKSIMRE